jgi:hypothetical protein
MKRYVRYVADEGFIQVEIDETEDDASGGTVKPGTVVKSGVEEKINETVNVLQVKFEDALDVVRCNAKAFTRKVRELTDSPDQMELNFGLKATGEGQLIIAKAALEANYTVKLTWSRLKKNREEDSGS